MIEQLLNRERASDSQLLGDIAMVTGGCIVNVCVYPISDVHKAEKKLWASIKLNLIEFEGCPNKVSWIQVGITCVNNFNYSAFIRPLRFMKTTLVNEKKTHVSDLEFIYLFLRFENPF